MLRQIAMVCTSMLATVRLGIGITLVLAGMSFAMANAPSQKFVPSFNGRQYGVTVAYDEIFTQNTRTRQNGGEWTDVVGSSSNAATIDMGVTYAVSKNFSIIGSVEIGVTPDAPDTQVSFSFPYHF